MTMARARLKLASALLALINAGWVTPTFAVESITGIEGDYDGYWSSSESNISSVFPDSTNNLLAFTAGGVRYSTGVNDATLDAEGLDYQAEIFRALSPTSLTANNVGQGSNDDGSSTDDTGMIYPVTGNNVVEYMIDGVNGLNLSTFGNNVPAVVSFILTGVDKAANADQTPEFLYFNMAGPKAVEVEFRLLDAAGIQLGEIAATPENAHPDIATVSNDRYRVSSNTAPGIAKNSIQEVQGFAIAFSDFDVDDDELALAKTLELTLPDEADPPFVAFRTSAMSICALADSDGDGICDLEEGFNSNNPSNSSDSDGDGDPDYLDDDSDGDGNPDSTDSTPTGATATDDSGNSGTAIDLLSNDDYLVDGDSNNTGVTTLSAAGGGSCLGVADFNASAGTLFYTPSNGDFGSTCTVAYEVCNNESGNLVCETATVSISLIIDSDNDGIVDSDDLDDDNDGIPDSVEGSLDTDGDGVPDSRDLDSDNDGIPGLLESGLSAAALAVLDSDNDGQVDNNSDFGSNGLANALETSDDSGLPGYDGDGLQDVVVDSDGDGIADFLDLDKDNDGIPDFHESGFSIEDVSSIDQDGNGVIDPSSQTAANTVGPDGVLDSIQGGSDGGSLNNMPSDADGDGVVDALDLDSDNDGIPDLLESGLSLSDVAAIDTDGDGQIDPASQTPANVVGADGLIDSAQGNVDGASVDALLQDTDGDRVQDYRDLDSDNDGLLDIIESGQTDADGNGLVDSALGASGITQSLAIDSTSIPDSDGDGIPDNREVDSDNNGVFDIAEPGVNPELAVLDADSDGMIDGSDDPNNDPDGDGIYGAADSNPDAFGTPVSEDSDGDGISDLEEQNGDANRDTDGDGILDHLDTDSDNDGFLDTVEETSNCTARDGSDAADDGDCDDNGVPDRLQNDALITAVTGVGRTSGALLLMLLLFVACRLYGLRTAVAKGILASLLLLVSTNVQAHDNYSARLVMPDDTQDRVVYEQALHGEKYDNPARDALEFYPGNYVGFGVGISHVDPDGLSNGFESDDSASTGYKALLGRQFKPKWAWELSYTNMGAAGLGNPINGTLDALVPNAEIDYTVPAAWLKYLPFDANRNLTADVRVGLSLLDNSASDSRIGFEKQSSVQLAFGVGAQWRFAQRYFARVDFDSYDRDANFTALTLGLYLKGHDAHRPQAQALSVPGQHLLAPTVVVEETVECESALQVLAVVNFVTNSADLSLIAKETLRDLIESESLDLVDIRGHSDSRGSDVYNLDLSKHRADAVHSFMLARGISALGLQSHGLGESHPVHDNATEEGRFENRRVELHSTRCM